MKLRNMVQGLLQLAGDSADGALLGTQRAADALVCIDGVGQQSGALLCGALLVVDMILILVTEVTDGGQNGVGSSLAQAAQSAVLNGNAQLFQQLDVAVLALAVDDALQDLTEALGADTAVDTLTAGFLGGEV